MISCLKSEIPVHSITQCSANNAQTPRPCNSHTEYFFFHNENILLLHSLRYLASGYGRVKNNPAVHVSQYSHGKHIIDLHQFADVFVQFCLKSEINGYSATQCSNQ